MVGANADGATTAARTAGKPCNGGLQGPPLHVEAYTPRIIATRGPLMPHKPQSPPEVVHLEVDGVLDLHHFKPPEVPGLVREYLHECKRLGIDEVRIIHGKGKGVLRAIVQDILTADPEVRSFGPAQDGSGWGVTIAYLGTDSAKRQAPSKPATQEATTTDKRPWWRKLFASSNKARDA